MGDKISLDMGTGLVSKRGKGLNINISLGG